MTFEEAKSARIKAELERIKCVAQHEDKMHLAKIVCGKVCDKINCRDCIIGDDKKCHGNIENARNSYIKEVVDWAEVKVPKKLSYLLDEVK